MRRRRVGSIEGAEAAERLAMQRPRLPQDEVTELALQKATRKGSKLRLESGIVKKQPKLTVDSATASLQTAIELANQSGLSFVVKETLKPIEAVRAKLAIPKKTTDRTLSIRLVRSGAKGLPRYRVVVARSGKTKGRFEVVDFLGTIVTGRSGRLSSTDIARDHLEAWISNGVKMSALAQAKLEEAGLLAKSSTSPKKAKQPRKHVEITALTS